MSEAVSSLRSFLTSCQTEQGRVRLHVAGAVIQGRVTRVGSDIVEISNDRERTLVPLSQLLAVTAE